MAVEAVDALSDVLPTQPVSAISSNTCILPGHQHDITDYLGTVAASQILSRFCSPSHNIARGGQHQLIAQSTTLPLTL